MQLRALPFPKFLAILAAAAIPGCMGGPPQDAGMPQDGDTMGMGARTEVLADGRVGELPAGPLGWVAFALPPSDEAVAVRHGLAFLYAANGTHTVRVNGSDVTLEPGEGVLVPNGTPHVHAHGEGLWEIRLMDPSASGGPEAPSGDVVFSSGALEGVPPPPVQARFIRVDLPPGEMTDVHSHPGPEFIYVTHGPLTYQNGLVGNLTLEAGDIHSMPPDTAVQKRNPNSGEASFLSLFLVDPERPFATAARFDGEGGPSMGME